jgi:AraC-like DNA-binding protein
MNALQSPHIYQFTGRLPRLVPHALPVRAFGFQTAKSDWIDKRFEVIAYSFVIHGRGSYREESNEWPVEGPCVLRQRPGRHYRYGPRTHWEEFYVTYEADCQSRLDMTEWQMTAPPVIRLGDPSSLRQAFQRLQGLCDGLGVAGRIDRVDQLFEALLLDVILEHRQPGQTGREERIQAARVWIDQHSIEAIRFEEVARRHGMSPRTFRRLWMARFGVTPGDYLAGVRVRHACALLAHTELPIAEVAAQSGFTDPFYFSRHFSRETGLSPRHFRNKARG